jgi:hypothetical protein
MSVRYPIEQKCLAYPNKGDCNTQSNQQCAWTDALNQCTPKCDQLPENRCTAYACSWDTVNNKCGPAKEGDGEAGPTCEERAKCEGQDAQGNRCVTDPATNQCLPSFVLTESPELMAITKPVKDTISAAAYQKRMKAGLITLYVILGLLVLAAIGVVFVQLGAAPAIASIITGAVAKIRSVRNPFRRREAGAPTGPTTVEDDSEPGEAASRTLALVPALQGGGQAKHYASQFVKKMLSPRKNRSSK